MKEGGGVEGGRIYVTFITSSTSVAKAKGKGTRAQRHSAGRERWQTRQDAPEVLATRKGKNILIQSTAI